MGKTLSIAGAERARRHDQALDEGRADRGRVRDAAHEQLPPSHSDPASRDVPNTHNGRVAPDTPTGAGGGQIAP
jgi:hypothetical protein